MLCSRGCHFCSPNPQNSGTWYGVINFSRLNSCGALFVSRYTQHKKWCESPKNFPSPNVVPFSESPTRSSKHLSESPKRFSRHPGLKRAQNTRNPPKDPKVSGGLVCKGTCEPPQQFFGWVVVDRGGERGWVDVSQITFWASQNTLQSSPKHPGVPLWHTPKTLSTRGEIPPKSTGGVFVCLEETTVFGGPRCLHARGGWPTTVSVKEMTCLENVWLIVLLLFFSSFKQWRFKFNPTCHGSSYYQLLLLFILLSTGLSSASKRQPTHG